MPSPMIFLDALSLLVTQISILLICEGKTSSAPESVQKSPSAEASKKITASFSPTSSPIGTVPGALNGIHSWSSLLQHTPGVIVLSLIK